MTDRIAIVGNAPTKTDISSAIDCADRVVRFNNAYGFGNLTGTRIDDLFLVNCGGQPLEWLQSNTFWAQDYMAATPQITLPFRASEQRRSMQCVTDHDPQSIESLNFEWDLRDAFRPFGKIISTLPDQTVSAAMRTLRDFGATGSRITPSTGYLAIYAYLDRCSPSTAIDIYGFTFAGWGGHSWSAERAWVDFQRQRGNLCLHEPGGPSSGSRQGQ